MLKRMRQYTKTVLWIVIIAFVGTIIFAWGAGGLKNRRDPNLIGVIDGVKITRQYYSTLYQNEYDKELKQSKDHELTDEQSKQIHNTVWNRIQNEVLLGKQIKNLDINVSDKELVEYMQKYPPQFLRSEPALQTDGKFDYNKYLTMLTNPDVNWLPIEQYVRNQLADLKLQTLEMTPFFITEDDVKREFEDKNITASVEYVYFKPSLVSKDIPDAPDSELEKFYNEHSDELSYLEEPERVQFTVASLFKYISPHTADSVMTLLNAVRDSILAGGDFGKFANKYSQDGAKNGGDLRWTKEGQFVPEFENQVLSIKPGEITKPFRSRFGFHIALFEGTRETKGADGKPVKEIKCKHILMRVEPEEEGRPEYELAIKDLNKAKNLEEFKEKVKKLGGITYETDPLSKSGRIPDLGNDSRKLIEWGLNSDEGSISDMYPTNTGYVVVYVKEKFAPEMPAFDKIKEFVAAKVKNDKAMKILEKKADDFIKDIKNPKNFKKVARKYGVEVKTLKDITIDKFISDIVNQNKFKAVVFSLNKDKPISKPIDVTSGIYVIRLLKKTDFDEKMYSAEHDSIYKALLRDKQSKLFKDWYKQIANSVEIKDYRDLESNSQS